MSKLKNREEYFEFLHKQARSKAKIVTHITKWKIRTEIGREIILKRMDSMPLIAALLLTDGHVYKKKTCWEIGFASKSSQLLNLFIDLAKIWNTNQIISKYIDKNKVTRLYFHLPFQNEILELSKSFKTAPRNQSILSYLKEEQPSLNFLQHFNKDYKKLFLRIVLSADGGITGRNSKNRLRPNLFLRCAHPSLCNQYRNLSDELSIKFRIEKDSTKWSRIGGLVTTNMESIKKFQEIGGFVEGLKISKKSRYFYNVQKNWLLNKYINNKASLARIIANARVAQPGFDRQKEQLT